MRIPPDRGNLEIELEQVHMNHPVPVQRPGAMRLRHALVPPQSRFRNGALAVTWAASLSKGRLSWIEHIAFARAFRPIAPCAPSK